MKNLSSTEVTNKLKEEHQLILQYIKLLNKFLLHFKEKPIEEQFFLKAKSFIAFIVNYSDHYHHAKEETILFKVANQPQVLTHCNPIPQMLYEHDLGRDFVRQMNLAIEEKKSSSLISNAEGWMQLLTEHIFKEDQILYPMLEEGLSQKDKIFIEEQYQLTEKSLNGDHLQELYVKLYLELENFLK